MHKFKMIVISIWFNREELVRESILSIINQTYKDYRIFAIDDGSSDQTGVRLEEMVEIANKKGVQMEVWKKQNEGFTPSIKKAIQMTSEEIIALHGAGDISYPERLKKQYDLLISDCKVVATGCGVRVLNLLDGTENSRHRKTHNRNVNLKSLPRPGTHGAAMFYKSIYQKAGGYRPFFRYAQDTDLWLRMTREGTILNVDEVLYDKTITSKTVSGDLNKMIHQIYYSSIAYELESRIENGILSAETMIDSNNYTNFINKKRINKRLLDKTKNFIIQRKFLLTLKFISLVIRFKPESLI